MKDKELKKLKRADLIEMLYYLSKENDELREENGKLRTRLDELVDRVTARSTAAEPLPSSDNDTYKTNDEQKDNE
ncbi:hypothetical protein [Ruminococcus flavefaciens]|uniref:Uncharacterized protein n=1 Tax=Ruminococcus flavefaciens 007c TaxID=1341157 RepID=W7USJ1_RUMFL|nr:hypothetical protein [Ruminococcus flavefaciens]EWM54384.1 hypothetical protein RF007C_12305 [Ruminococcus flavefaciens 007c]